MSYSIFRLDKIKNNNAIRALQRHIQRENKKYSNIDHSKSHLNYDFINKDKINFVEKIEQRIEEGYTGKRKIRSNAIRLVDGLVTSDKSFFDRLSNKKQFFKDCLEFIKQEFGEKILFMQQYI